MCFSKAIKACANTIKFWNKSTKRIWQTADNMPIAQEYCSFFCTPYVYLDHHPHPSGHSNQGKAILAKETQEMKIMKWHLSPYANNEVQYCTIYKTNICRKTNVFANQISCAMNINKYVHNPNKHVQYTKNYLLAIRLCNIMNNILCNT